MLVNDLSHVWKENRRLKLFQCYLYINKGYDHNLFVDDGKSDDTHGKVTEDI